MVVIHSCGDVIANRGCSVATMFIIFGGVVIASIISITAEVGVIINFIRRIIVSEGSTIAVGKDNPTGIVSGKGMYTVNDLIRHGNSGLFVAEILPA